MQLPPPPPGGRECDDTLCESRLCISPSAYTARPTHLEHNRTAAFTLVELSIALVIIGLIIGGVLTGQSLISAAAVRAQVTQIEKFNSAANTFFGKYGYLPGDIPSSQATQLGLTARSGAQGFGDGNGVLEDGAAGSPVATGLGQGDGEVELFWIDLTTANGMNLNLIDGTFSSIPIPINSITPASFNSALPQAKIGGGNYIYVWSTSGTNYFGISRVTTINLGTVGGLCTLPALTVAQAYAIDVKVDDGLPQLGNVTARHVVYDTSKTSPSWAAAPGVISTCGDSNTHGASPGSAASPSSLTCFDNQGSSVNPMSYSLSQSAGSNVNCALSFKMQAGD